MSEAANSTVLHGTEVANWGVPSRTVISGLIGGIASRIVGGNFAEGFSIAAAGYLYNDATHRGYRDDGDVTYQELQAAAKAGNQCTSDPVGQTFTEMSEDRADGVLLRQYPVFVLDSFSINPDLSFEHGFELGLDITGHMEWHVDFSVEVTVNEITCRNEPTVCTVDGTQITGYVPVEISRYTMSVYTEITSFQWRTTGSYTLPSPPPVLR